MSATMSDESDKNAGNNGNCNASCSADSNRRFWLKTTCVAGGAAAVATAVPFATSFAPSERAKAAGAPVEVDLSGMQPGELKTVEWRGKPVWVLRRDKAMLDSLTKNSSNLADPDSKSSEQPGYVKGAARAQKDEYLVVLGICTHLGCSPTSKPMGVGDMGDNWNGGFYCPCHGSKFDLAGRVFSGSPAPTNLAIPPHKYLSDTRLLIGEDQA